MKCALDQAILLCFLGQVHLSRTGSMRISTLFQFLVSFALLAVGYLLLTGGCRPTVFLTPINGSRPESSRRLRFCQQDPPFSAPIRIGTDLHLGRETLRSNSNSGTLDLFRYQVGPIAFDALTNVVFVLCIAGGGHGERWRGTAKRLVASGDRFLVPILQETLHDTRNCTGVYLW